MSNLFGLVNGKLIGEAPLYVDRTKRPGGSEVPRATLIGWIRNAPLVLITSPNFVWAMMALVIYNYNPYPTNVMSPITYGFMKERLQLWIPTVLGYFFLTFIVSESNSGKNILGRWGYHWEINKNIHI